MGRGGDARGRMRLFVAAPLPRSAVDAIAAAVAPWREVSPRVRWVPAENLHLTIAFLGSTEVGTVPWVLEAIGRAAAAVEPVRAALGGLGTFPPRGRARVLWAGVDDEGGRLTMLADGVRRALESEFPPDRRPFTAHVTVARADPPVALPSAFTETPLGGPPFPIDAIGLWRSTPAGPSPRYETLGSVRLGGSSD